MPRLCGHCGYDVTALPHDGGRRTCPECGHVGRGVRPTLGVDWPIRRALRPTLRWAAAVLALGAAEGALSHVHTLRDTAWLLVLRILWILACGSAVLASFAAGPAWAETWGERTLPKRKRAGQVGGLGALSAAVNLAVIAAAIILSALIVSSWDG